MSKSFTGRKRVRKSFGRITEVASMPNLIEVQKRSYDQFLMSGVEDGDRTDIVIAEVFKSVFPIKDFSEIAQLEYVDYELEKPKYDVEECQQRGMTYAAPLKVTLRLVVWDVEEETGARSIRDIKEQGGEATFLQCDVGMEKNVKNMVHKTIAIYGRIDIGIDYAAVFGQKNID